MKLPCISNTQKEMKTGNKSHDGTLNLGLRVQRSKLSSDLLVHRSESEGGLNTVISKALRIYLHGSSQAGSEPELVRASTKINDFLRDR